MAVGDGILFIWLDRFIGRAGAYQQFRIRFQKALEETASVPPDSINVLIWNLEQNVGPFLFAHKVYEAINLIKKNQDKQIILISSASLGKFLVPRVSNRYVNLYRYYIFCQDIEKHMDFFLKYAACMLPFTHETDLLARLTRDISRDIIQQGRDYIEINEPKNALKCYDLAVTLNVKANELDDPINCCLTYLRQLKGSGNSVGLIQEAKNMLNQP
jgi:tetratricopeptide (TPR) repeat protein